MIKIYLTASARDQLKLPRAIERSENGAFGLTLSKGSNGPTGI